MSEQTMAMSLPGLRDLQREYPRSPGDTLGPYVLLPRILDKCRAVAAGVNGPYNYNCPLDRRFFDFMEVDAEAFRAEVADGKSDKAMLAWVAENSAAKTEDEILTWAYDTRTARPDTPERKAHYEKMRADLCPGNPYVETWFQLLDADEGRFWGKNPVIAS